MKKDIVKKVESLQKIDQESIKKYKRGQISTSELKKINLENLKYLKEIIRKYGFPFKDTYSKKAFISAFLIVQHSNDIKFMKKIAKIFEKSNSKQIDKELLGYLIDKIRIMENLPQFYGTQYKINNKKELIFFDIEDPKNLEKRRKSLGMETLDKYNEKSKKSYK